MWRKTTEANDGSAGENPQLLWAGGFMLLVAVITGCKLLQEYYELGFWPMAGLVSVGALLLLAERLIPQVRNHWMLWLGLSLGVATHIVTNWPGPANHAYVFVYLCLILLVTAWQAPEDRALVFAKNTQYLLLAILVIATFQRIITPGYLDGSINAFWLANGGYGKPLYTFSSGWSEVVRSNHELLNGYYNGTPYRVDSLQLEAPISNLRFWGQVVSIGTLATEMVVGVLFVWGRTAAWKHVPLIGLVLLVFVTREESGFLSLLCIMGIANTGSGSTAWRWIYVALIAAMQLLLLANFGFV